MKETNIVLMSFGSKSCAVFCRNCMLGVVSVVFLTTIQEVKFMSLKSEINKNYNTEKKTNFCYTQLTLLNELQLCSPKIVM